MPRFSLPRPRGKGASPRPDGLARVVLCLLPVLPACIIPLGPEWQDPLAERNASPVIVDSSPKLGSIHVASPPGGTTFSVTVSDPNVRDTLYVRFLADYPPATPNTRLLGATWIIPPSADGSPLQRRVSATPDCAADDLVRMIPTHQIHVLVADSEFVGSVQQPESIQDPARRYVIGGSWTLELDCP